MRPNLSLYVPIYSITLLLSAFLLFIIQPLFGKMLLPLLGGSPQVWNTAMVFFQAILLAGYAYAHLSARFSKPYMQGVLHITLFLLFVVALPIAIPEQWTEPPATSNPALWQLMMMTAIIGGPFFVLSGTAPLLQRWFSYTDHPDAHNPYFLYAASNLGSMTSLLLYPVAIEPLMALKQQSLSWAAGYGLLILLIGFCVFLTVRIQPAQTVKSESAANDNKPAVKHILLWLVLAFIPSSLMLGVTTHITTDLASVPLLWVLPLALYVGTFIIAFAHIWPVKLNTVLFFQAFLTVLILVYDRLHLALPMPTLIILHLLLFFLTALFCHMQLALLRPAAKYLTVFYLVMSLGGVLGGIFNALLAPMIFIVPVEYMVILILAAILRHITDPHQSLTQAFSYIKGKNIRALFSSQDMTALAVLSAVLLIYIDINALRIVIATGLMAALLLLQKQRWSYLLALGAVYLIMMNPFSLLMNAKDSLAVERNYFGILHVADHTSGVRRLIHGTTLHGEQPLNPELRLTPVSYYYEGSPAGDIFDVMDTKPMPQKIAGLGLGVGTIACFAKEGRSIEFFEIDPAVADIAENPELFTYLSDCGTPYEITFGDARLQIAKAPDHSYDLIFVDVFSSDNIPIHIMTKEAFDLYLKKLKPGGLIVMNLSNRYLDLPPVVAAIARDLNISALFKSEGGGTIPDTQIRYAGTIFAVLSPYPRMLDSFTDRGWYPLTPQPSQKAWRDDYSNLLGALRTRQAQIPVASENIE